MSLAAASNRDFIHGLLVLFGLNNDGSPSGADLSELPVFQIVMFGAALLAAVPRMWVRPVALVILLAGFFISGASVGLFYIPTVFAAGRVMTRDERPAVQPGQEGPGK